MDNTEKRIWQYLDGELSAKQSTALEQRLAADSTFKAQYEAAHKLHAELKGLPLESAPADLMQSIMAGVAEEKIYIPKQTSFIDLKYILGIFGGMNLLLLAYQLLKGGNELAGGFSMSEFLGKYSTSLQGSQFAMPDLPSHLMPYGMALGLMLVLFWADQLANKLRPSKRRA